MQVANLTKVIALLLMMALKSVVRQIEGFALGELKKAITKVG